MVLARYSAVSSGQVIPAKRPNDQQSELIGIKYLKQLSVCASAYQVVTAPIENPPMARCPREASIPAISMVLA